MPIALPGFLHSEWLLVVELSLVPTWPGNEAMLSFTVGMCYKGSLCLVLMYICYYGNGYVVVLVWTFIVQLNCLTASS